MYDIHIYIKNREVDSDLGSISPPLYGRSSSAIGDAWRQLTDNRGLHLFPVF